MTEVRHNCDRAATSLAAADNLALIERNRELECELARLKARLGRVDRIADRLHDEARAVSDAYGDGLIERGAALVMAHKFALAGELRGTVR